MITTDKQKRVTFSLPLNIDNALDQLKKETKRSKSELINIAIENYLQEQKKIKLQKAVELMSKEYENSNTLTEFTSLDSEPFYEAR